LYHLASLYDGTTEFFGEVPDNAAKFYSLKLILKTNWDPLLLIPAASFSNEQCGYYPGSNSSQLEPLNDTNWPMLLD